MLAPHFPAFRNPHAEELGMFQHPDRFDVYARGITGPGPEERLAFLEGYLAKLRGIPHPGIVQQIEK